MARAIKPVRALKLVRLLRVSSMWSALLVRLDLPPVCFRAVKTACLLLLALHLSACGWWRLKAEMDPGGLAEDFLGSRGVALGDVGSQYVLCLYFMVTIFATGAMPSHTHARTHACTHTHTYARTHARTLLISSSSLPPSSGHATRPIEPTRSGRRRRRVRIGRTANQGLI